MCEFERPAKFSKVAGHWSLVDGSAKEQYDCVFMVFGYLIASSCHFLKDWIWVQPSGSGAASESWEDDWGLCAWLIALVLIVLLISCSSNCIWGEIVVLVNSSTLELRVMPFEVLTVSSSGASVSSVRDLPNWQPPRLPPLLRSVTQAPEKQVPNCLSLNKFSFNMQKAGFIGLNGLRWKQKKGEGVCPAKAPS